MDDKQKARLEKLRIMFQAEATEHIQFINQALLDIERGLDEQIRSEKLREAYRAAHNIKGSARMVGIENIERIAHAVESVMQAVINTQLDLSTDVCDLIYDALDATEKEIAGEEIQIDELLGKLSALVDNLTLETTEIQDAPITVPDSNGKQNIITSDSETIRVNVDKLDALIAEIGELQVSKMNADMHIVDLQDIMRQIDHFSRNWSEIHSLITHNIQTNQNSHLHGMLDNQATQVQTLLDKTQQIVQSSTRDTMRLGMVTDDLRDRVRSIRMLPFQTIALGFERAVRDAANIEGKQIKFEIIGAETELDKSVLEILKDPLMHLLNNAVSHGIESTEERTQANKLEGGSIQLKIQQRGNEVIIAVSDDGHGFDLTALLEAAPSSNLDIDTNSEDIIQLAFQAGVSTAKQVSTISGRGMGLDVVRDKLEAIHGRIHVDTELGMGTTIEMLVPTSLAITRSLLIYVNGDQYALPIASIEKIIEVSNILDVNDTQVVNVDGQHIPLVSLASILELPNQIIEAGQILRALILRSAEQRIAILVDDVLTEQELSLKSMGALLRNVRHVAGTAMLGNGLPIIVLSPADIMRSANQSKGRSIASLSVEQEQEETISAHILVVDDSITTRTLEQNILEAAGYLVTTAINGIEALKQLSQAEFDIVISDIQMPEMDGFELVERIRQFPEYRDLPLILVTSLETREDKERGMRAGADAYIVKRGFDQVELITMVEQFIHA